MSTIGTKRQKIAKKNGILWKIKQGLGSMY